MSNISVSVENVSMMFNMSRNKEDGIKEYFINMVKHNLKFQEFWALRNINFQVEQGASLALMGVNGSGKSTLLKVIAGILQPTKGRVITNGTIAPLIEITGGFDRSLTARENIYLSGAMHGHTKKYIDRHFDEIIDFAELEKFVDVPIKSFSSGMLARLGFAVATSVNADIVIADEVLSVGDMAFRIKCEDRIQKLLGNGTTFLFVSHNTSQVKKLCKNAIWLEKGVVTMAGTSNEVADEYYRRVILPAQKKKEKLLDEQKKNLSKMIQENENS